MRDKSNGNPQTKADGPASDLGRRWAKAWGGVGEGAGTAEADGQAVEVAVSLPAWIEYEFADGSGGSHAMDSAEQAYRMAFSLNNDYPDARIVVNGEVLFPGKERTGI